MALTVSVAIGVAVGSNLLLVLLIWHLIRWWRRRHKRPTTRAPPAELAGRTSYAVGGVPPQDAFGAGYRGDQRALISMRKDFSVYTVRHEAEDTGRFELHDSERHQMNGASPVSALSTTMRSTASNSWTYR